MPIDPPYFVLFIRVARQPCGRFCSLSVPTPLFRLPPALPTDRPGVLCLPFLFSSALADGLFFTVLAPVTVCKAPAPLLLVPRKSENPVLLGGAILPGPGRGFKIVRPLLPPSTFPSFLECRSWRASCSFSELLSQPASSRFFILSGFWVLVAAFFADHANRIRSTFLPRSLDPISLVFAVQIVRACRGPPYPSVPNHDPEFLSSFPPPP